MKFPINEIISLLDERLEYNLAESTNKDLVLKEIWNDAFCEGLKNLKLEYGTSKGNVLLRKKIGVKLNVDENQIVITNGAAFGIFLSVLCTCEIGDEIITVKPNFPPTLDIIESLGFKKILIKLSFKNGYQIDIVDLFSKITERTKLIILVSPLNPTGTIHSRNEIVEIADRLSIDYPNCKLVIDETYREATYGSNMTIPTYAGLQKNIITISSLSKCHGTPGLRIGWLQCNDKEFIEQVGVAKMNLVISNSVLDEYVALNVLKSESKIFQKRRIHSSLGLKLTKNWIEANIELIDWVEPQAGALCCVMLRENLFNEKQIGKFYSSCKNVDIQIANGEWFGESKRFFRLGFGYMEIDKLETTLDKLSAILKDSAINI